jgi:ABC-type nitrate/sulfonate/bicarbonate transport system substrate-binding protein
MRIDTKLSFILTALLMALPGFPADCSAQIQTVLPRTAYSALSAGIGTFWLSHDEGYFKKRGLKSNLVYIRGGSTAVPALLAGEIQFGHLSPAPMLTAWAQGADFVWIGSTTNQMVFTLITDASITRGAGLKDKKIGITRLGSASDLALRAALEHLGVAPKGVTMMSLGGIPEILAALRAGAGSGILSPPTSTAARDLGYRPLLHVPDLGREFTFSGIAAKRSFVQSQPEVARAYMTALTTTRKFIKKQPRCAPRVAQIHAHRGSHCGKRLQGIRQGDFEPALSGLKGLEAVRDSLLETTRN